MEVLEEMEGKAVIWAHYRYDIQSIVETVSKKYGENSVVTYLLTIDKKQLKKYRTLNLQLDLLLARHRQVDTVLL
jgi:hypothetical protein